MPDEEEYMDLEQELSERFIGLLYCPICECEMPTYQLSDGTVLMSHRDDKVHNDSDIEAMFYGLQ